MTDTELKDHIKEVIKPKAVRESLAAIRSSLRGDGSHPDAELFQEYRRAGGMTGWMQSYDNIEDHMAEIKREVSGWEIKKVRKSQVEKRLLKYSSG